MARRPKNEYANWIHLLSETSAIRELLAAELENLAKDCNAEFIKESVLESPEIGDRITKKVFDAFIDLIGVKIMESPDKEFYVPNFGTFAVKTHRGHKVKLNPREDDGEVVNLSDYKMLRFKPDDKFKADILCTLAPNGNMSAELTGAWRGEQGKKPSLLDLTDASLVNTASINTDDTDN